MIKRIIVLAFLSVGGERPVDAAMITGGTDIDTNNGYQCVEVAGGYTKPGTPVQSWDCWGGFNQQWQFYEGQILGIGSEINGQGLANRNCLDVAGSSAGSSVVLNRCDGRSSQHWIVQGGHIESASTHLCLDLGQGYAISGVQLTVTTCGQGLAQRFAIR